MKTVAMLAIAAVAVVGIVGFVGCGKKGENPILEAAGSAGAGRSAFDGLSARRGLRPRDHFDDRRGESCQDFAELGFDFGNEG